VIWSNGLQTPGNGKLSVLVRIDESSVTLTPFGSVIRTDPVKPNGGTKSWTGKLRALLASLFR
jgi:hypothetical protein